MEPVLVGNERVWQWQRVLAVASGVLLTVLAVALFSSQNAYAASHATVAGVNAALRAAGVPVTAESQMKYAEGVALGHYTTTQQLVDAIKWHKAHGKVTPNVSKFRHPHDPHAARSLRGEIVEISSRRVEVLIEDAQGNHVHMRFFITSRTTMRDHLIAGDQVEVTYLPKTKDATKVRDLSPPGEEDRHGSGDCQTCPGPEE